MDLDQVLSGLSTGFLEAQKALTYMTERYLWFDKRRWFGAG